MKIGELTEAQLSPELSAAISRLRKKGWQLLGKGAFGAVMEKKGLNWVLKMFPKDDAAYLAFVDLVQKHPNPHFPVFTGNVLQASAGFCVIRVEKLTSPTSYMKFAHLTGLYMETIAEPVSQSIQQCREYVQTTPSLQQACDLIAHNLLSRFNLDLETKDNVMMRGDTFVFSDPVAVALDG